MKHEQTIEDQLTNLLLSQKITPERFKLPLTFDVAATYIRAAVRAEILRRHRIPIISGEQERTISLMAQYLTATDRFGLALIGSVGNGKTTLVRAIQAVIDHLNIEDPYSIRPFALDIRTAVELTRLDDDTYRRYCNTKLLAIDDLGNEPTEVLSYGNTTYPIIELLTTRYERQLYTIITTNLTPAQIRDKYGDRIADRLNEMCHTVTFTYPTFRSAKPTTLSHSQVIAEDNKFHTNNQ